MRKLAIAYILSLFLTGVIPVLTQAQSTEQQPPIKDWFLRDPEQDQLQGVSAEKAYITLLAGQPSRTVIVAVVDSGIDINHEDLKSIIWINEDEIPDNGIDDDKNGYIDDLNGWNFIGGKNGNVKDDTYELTREYIRLKKRFENTEDSKVPKKQKAEYEHYIKTKDKYEKLKAKNEQQYGLYKNIQANVILSIDTIKAILKTDSLTQESLQEFTTTDPTLLYAKGFLLNIFKNVGPEASIESLLDQLKEAVDYFGVIVNYGYNENFDSRQIIGDDYSNAFEKNYGNNDVKGPDPSHGTHVAGIISADRKNNIGIKGIADNVRIMSVRAVPNGDERDKDVANAIIYAVDNGAKIINMSFGKSFSPEKVAVDKAVKYAEQKGVLLVHAAGNDGEDIEENKNFPSRYYLNGKEAMNWLEIGASAWGTEQDFVGSFSNYGKKSVDFFAPGVEIYSTTPNNTYKSESGTSSASPTTAGVAAILMSYFPEFSAVEVKDILKKSTRKFDNLKVASPGGKGNIKFSELSNTGGLVNAYEAVKMAQLMKAQKSAK